jgi:hypothetical protein
MPRSRLTQDSVYLITTEQVSSVSVRKDVIHFLINSCSASDVVLS